MKSMKWSVGWMLAVLMCAPAAAQAADGAAIARANNCMTCHGVETRKMMGPSFKEIADRYRGKNVEAAMIDKIKNGGAGAWGPVAMPAQPQLSDADARAITKWMLAR
ncbi:MAG: c-type cytochrome [Brachymonas sp.]|nr:c-type cytochrome [Brachymonas sp.]